MIGEGPGSRRRARMLRMMSALWRPSARASAQARQSVRKHGGKNFDHLAVAVIGTGKFSPHALQSGGQYPILERSAIAQGAWLASQDQHVVPWIIDRFAASIAARMLRNDAPLLADDDPIGVSVNLDRPPH